MSGSLIAGAQVGAYDMTLGVAPFDFETNQYSGTPMDRPEYDLNGNLAALYAQAGGELLMMTGLQQGGPGGALQQSINDDIAAGGQWADLTSDESIGVDDIDLFGQFLEAQQGGGGGGGEGGASGGGLEGCGENDPNCTFYQHVASIAYDYRNQMVEYTDLDNLRTHRYHYDCFGRRVAKVVDHGLTTAKATRFIYGGQASWQVLAEFDAFQPSSGVPASASYVFGSYIDEPIQTRRDFDGVGAGAMQDFYYHQDELFNVVAISAGQNGTTLPRHAGVYNTGDVIERIKYGDYGSPTVMQGASGTIAFTSLVGNRYMFTGREYDGELGWSYYRTRYLEHEWGRFTTRDTIGVWGDSSNLGNGLAFVHSSPNSELDSFGLHPGDGLSPGDRWTPRDGWQPAPMRDIKYFAPNPEFTHKYFDDPTGEPMWLSPDLARRFVESPSVQNLMQEIDGIMKSMLESLYAGLRCPSPSTATSTHKLRRTTDVTNVPKLYSIGNSSIGITITCTASLECPSGKRSGGCKAQYELRDSFADPFGIGVEIGTPYPINHDWESECSH